MARVLFLGTPEFGVPVLEALAREHQVVAAVTQPDRPAGRGRKLQASPVKLAAQTLGIPVVQPARLRRNPAAVEELRRLGADVWVLAAFGQILPAEVLAIPPRGCIGVHASLLPRHRGAAPVAAAILAGDEETGVTLMLTDVGMDTGAIIAQRSLPIRPEDTTGTLTERLAHLGAELVVETLPAWLRGEIEPRPQDDSRATLAPPIQREWARIAWAQPAALIARQVRAYNPWPVAVTELEGSPLRIWAAHVADTPAGDLPGPPGRVVEHRGKPGVVTGEGLLVLDVVQPPGKRAMPADAYVRGRPSVIGAVLV